MGLQLRGLQEKLVDNVIGPEAACVAHMPVWVQHAVFTAFDL